MVSWWFSELDLTPGALAIKRVSGVAGVPDVVVLSVLSGLVCSGTWKGTWAGLIDWWFCWRSSRLDSTYRNASVLKSMCPKTRLSALKSLSCFRLSDASCGSCLTLHQGLQDTGTLRTGVFFLLDINHWTRIGCMPAVDKAWPHAGCGRISLIQQNQPRSLLSFSAFSKGFLTTFTADWAFLLDLGRYGDKITSWNSHCLANSVNALLTKCGPLSVTIVEYHVSRIALSRTWRWL